MKKTNLDKTSKTSKTIKKSKKELDIKQEDPITISSNIHDCLGIEKIRWCDFYLLTKSIAIYSEDKIVTFENYNPYFSLFEDIIRLKDYYKFNTKKSLDCQVSASEGLIAGKIKNIYTKKISFIGEDFEKLHLFANACPSMNSIGYFNVNNKTIAMLQYDLNSGPNIEIFMSYLVSIIKEKKLCPTFNYFYFSCHAVIKRFNYKIENDSLSYKTMRIIYSMIKDSSASFEVDYDYDDEDDDNCDEEEDDNNNIVNKSSRTSNITKTSRTSRTSHITKTSRTSRTSNITKTSNSASITSSQASLSDDYIIEDNIILTVKNHPCYLLITEQNDADFSLLLDNKDAPAIKSVIFQVFAAIVIAYDLFSIKNNDLHTGNIMLKKTKKKVLKYKIGRKIYAVPTFGYIAKIIDWGRGTYGTKMHEGNNLIYNDKLYLGFYNFNPKTSNPITLPSNFRYSDIAIFCHSILNDFYNHDLEDNEEFSTLRTFINQFCSGLKVEEYSWQIYADIMKMQEKFTIRDLFGHKFFDEYLTVNNKGHIYVIPDS